MFPSRISRSGRVADLSHMYEAIGRTGGEKFWFHGLRNCFITVTGRELLLLLPLSLTKRLLNHARPSDVNRNRILSASRFQRTRQLVMTQSNLCIKERKNERELDRRANPAHFGNSHY